MLPFVGLASETAVGMPATGSFASSSRPRIALKYLKRGQIVPLRTERDGPAWIVYKYKYGIKSEGGCYSK